MGGFANDDDNVNVAWNENEIPKVPVRYSMEMTAASNIRVRNECSHTVLWLGQTFSQLTYLPFEKLDKMGMSGNDGLWEETIRALSRLSLKDTITTSPKFPFVPINSTVGD